MTPPRSSPASRREVGPELLVLAHWEEFTGWLLGASARWPRSARFTLTQRIQNHALDITEKLVAARYDPARRAGILAEVNLLLERMRFLFRIAFDTRVIPRKGFETAMRGLESTGRRIHGWRRTLGRGKKA